MENILNNLRVKLFKPVDASSLAVFRIGFGLIMLWEVWRYWAYGWIESKYIEPEFFFKYYNFEWVTPWSGDLMYWHYGVTAVLALFITIGFLYRISTVLFFFAFSYIFLLDQAQYLNHIYLVLLVALLLCFLPANRYLAVDAKINPGMKSPTVPLWSIWLIMAQFEVVYIYAGLVKLNGDWLRLEPLSSWLSSRSDFPVLGELFMQDWSVAVAAYGITILHIFGAPLLLFKKTRIYIFCVYACFHTLNHFVFSIGIFPWLTLFATLAFFDPDWPKQVWRYLKSMAGKKQEIKQKISQKQLWNTRYWKGQTPATQTFIMAAIGVWFAYQVLMPLRHFLYPGNVAWTEEGHRYAWQMKLRSKQGSAVFYVKDADSNREWVVYPSEFLTSRQVRKMAGHPDMILQFAHFLCDKWKMAHNLSNVEVRVKSVASLNGRKFAQMIDHTVDLVNIERNLSSSDWILPLTEPLNRDPSKYRDRYQY